MFPPFSFRCLFGLCYSYIILFSGSEAEETKVHSGSDDLSLGKGIVVPEKVANGGFVVPENNAFGHSFR